MTTKWTKGPWRVGPYYKHEVVSHDGVICCAPIETEQTRANAHLIASAPALYAELDRLIETVRLSAVSKYEKFAIEKADAALRAARGEQ